MKNGMRSAENIRQKKAWGSCRSEPYWLQKIKNDMNCIYCKNAVHDERVALGFNYCVVCAGKRPIAAYKGIMVFGHKTAGTMQVVSPENFADYRRHNPYGRYTGRGSGIHRVTKTTSCQ